MLNFAIEAYASGLTSTDLMEFASEARAAAEAMQKAELRVRGLNSISYAH
jgi:hypothetical protein